MEYSGQKKFRVTTHRNKWSTDLIPNGKSEQPRLLESGLLDAYKQCSPTRAWTEDVA